MDRLIKSVQRADRSFLHGRVTDKSQAGQQQSSGRRDERPAVAAPKGERADQRQRQRHAPHPDAAERGFHRNDVEGLQIDAVAPAVAHLSGL